MFLTIAVTIWRVVYKYNRSFPSHQPVDGPGCNEDDRPATGEVLAEASQKFDREAATRARYRTPGRLMWWRWLALTKQRRRDHFPRDQRRWLRRYHTRVRAIFRISNSTRVVSKALDEFLADDSLTVLTEKRHGAPTPINID